MVFLLNFMKCEVKSEDKIYIYTVGLLSRQSVNTSKSVCCLLYNDNNDGSRVITLSTKSLLLFGQISTAVRSERFQFLFVSKIGSDLSPCRVWSPALLRSFSRQLKCWRNPREGKPPTLELEWLGGWSAGGGWATFLYCEVCGLSWELRDASTATSHHWVKADCLALVLSVGSCCPPPPPLSKYLLLF